MLHRWLTYRCWKEDVPQLGTVRGGVTKFLAEQDPKSSGTEAFKQANRGDVFTYHYGDGRGVRWEQDERSVLWLCAFAESHDGGYTHAADLQASGVLYLDLDPDWRDGAGTLLPWGEHLDEDAYEWARAIYGALETFEINRAALEQGDRITYPCPSHVELVKDEDDIWTLTIRRRLGYLPPKSQRGRWLTNGEIEQIFRHIARDADPEFAFDNPPHPKSFLFADVHFLGGPTSPADWLERVAENATESAERPLPPFNEAPADPA
jgi:hypothetical protein